MARRFISIVCPEWKRRVARRYISIVTLMEKESGSLMEKEEWLVDLYLLEKKSGS